MQLTQLNGREHGQKPPVIILSMRGRKVRKIVPPDDQRARPFNLDDLVARIHAALRGGSPAVKQLRSGKVSIDFVAQRAVYGKRKVRLTLREFDILEYLARRQDRVVYRRELLREIWGYSSVPQGTRLVDQAIFRLRKKLQDDPGRAGLIRTAHGNGYRLVYKQSRRVA